MPMCSTVSKEPKREDVPVSLIELSCMLFSAFSQERARLQADRGAAALKLMDCIFSTEEMVNGNPSGVTRSNDATRQKTIHPLHPEEMRFIDGMVYNFTVVHFYRYLAGEVGGDHCR